MIPVPVVEVLNDWTARLNEAGVECAAIESEIIYCHYAGFKRLSFDRLAIMPEPIRQAGEKAIRRRQTREPLQYILGTAPFMNLELEVNPAVLIPRPETELLVEFLLKELPSGGRLLDVGTGSGAIALAAAYERPDIQVLALDISAAALEVAQRNRAKYGLEKRVEFRQSNLLFALGENERFEAIAANLPYIAESEYAGLQPEVRDYEPKSALTAPAEGLALMFELLPQAVGKLRPGGVLILEMGCAQGQALSERVSAAGYEDVRVIKDYHNLDRLVVGRKT